METATPSSVAALIYAAPIFFIRSLSSPKVRTFKIGFRKLPSISTTGANAQFTPTAAPSAQDTFPS